MKPAIAKISRCRSRVSGARRKFIRPFIICTLLPIAACEPAVLDPRGPVSLAERAILVDSLGIMLSIVVPTIIATLAFAWWFRVSNKRAAYLPSWAYSGKIELVTWSVPLLTITLLGGVAWISSHDLDPAKPLVSKTMPIEVQVVSLDWKWLFIYPAQRVASVNRLVVPSGTPIHFSLTSASVMSAFFIPQLGGMIYTMNGMATQLFLQASAPATFRGLSSHFNGEGFADMHFDVVAVPQDGFETWVNATRGSGPNLDRATYADLSRQSSGVKAFTYRAADPDLFQQVVRQSLPPGPGPIEETNSGASTHAEK